MTLTISVYQHIIFISDDNYIKFFNSNFVNIVFKTCKIIA